MDQVKFIETKTKKQKFNIDMRNVQHYICNMHYIAAPRCLNTMVVKRNLSTSPFLYKPLHLSLHIKYIVWRSLLPNTSITPLFCNLFCPAKICNSQLQSMFLFPLICTALSLTMAHLMSARYIVQHYTKNRRSHRQLCLNIRSTHTNFIFKALSF